MVPVIPPGIISQHHQVIPYLARRLPQLLLLLPAPPPVQPCRTERHDQREGDQHFHEGKALLLFHGGSVP